MEVSPWTQPPMSADIGIFFGTIIDVNTGKNPDKRGTVHQIRQIHGVYARLYLKLYYSLRDIGTAKCIKIRGGVNKKNVIL